MNYFLGIFPNDKARYRLSKLIPEVGRVVDSHGIPFSSVKPENLHVTVLYLGGKMPFFRKLAMDVKLKRFSFEPFVISIDAIKLGSRRTAKETVFGSIGAGAEILREIVYQLDETLGFERLQTFTPHMTLGRIAKDLSEEESRNLNYNLSDVNRSYLSDEIKFLVDSIYFVISEHNSYKLAKKFSAS